MIISALKKINSYFKIKTRIKLFIKGIFVCPFFLTKANWLNASVAESLQSISFKAEDDKDYIYTTSNPLLLWRAQTLFTKEPETIQWIRSMKPNEVLYDVGANVGMYSIYAGKRGMRVFSFEPEASNTYVLNKNIAENKLSDKVTAYSFALSDQELVNILKLTSFVPGSAHTTFGDNDAFSVSEFPTLFHQGCFCTTLDDLVYKYNLPVPNHIKIDVDGIESKIIKGANKLLNDKNLRSILIELNEDFPEDQWVKTFLASFGFKPVTQSKGDIALKGKMQMYDYIFRRD